MLNSQLPAKWLKPFAADDANKVEIPLTTGDATRASQSLGFPPLTMQPPESGGVPPQGEDFNGAMNQVARIVWWLMAGGGIPFDSTWSANAAINGYPQGASITSADLLGEWFSTADNNLVNPDTVGTGWVPGYSYGATAITGLTNANVTLTPAQAAKNIIRLSGTLTGNVQIIFPVWQKEWVIVNITTGAFTVTCKTAAGAGVVVSQTGGMQIVMGDSVNLFALGGNSALPLVVGPATAAAHAVPLAQAAGVVGSMRNLKMSLTVAAASGTMTADEIIVETALGGARYCLPSFNKTINLATTGAGGMDTGAAPASGFVGLYAIYNPTSGVSALLATNATATAMPSIYGGANMPSGYTASALVGVWPTTAGSLFVIGHQTDREFSFVWTSALLTATQQPSPTSLSVASLIPLSAKFATGIVSNASTTATAIAASIMSNAGQVGMQQTQASGGTAIWGNWRIPIITPQTIFYSATVTAGTMSLQIWPNGYAF